MSINIIVGRPGSGKSYESIVYHVLPALKEGRKVVTNLPLNLEHFEKVFGSDVLDLIDIKTDSFSKENGVIKSFSDPSDFTDDEWKNEKQQGPLFVIDECHFVYPSSNNKKGSLINECLEYFSMHRHYGHDILLMTQSLGKLHKDLRAMIQIQYAVSKHTAAGSDKSYSQKVYDGALPRANKVNDNLRIYKKEYFPFYQSHTMSDKSVNEAHAKDVKPFYKHWVFYLLAIFVVVFIYMVSQGHLNPMAATEKLSENSSSLKPSKSENPSHLNDNKISKTIVDTVKPTNTSEPFDSIKLHIAGFSDSSYIDDLGRFIEQKKIYFNGSKNGRIVADLKLSDFYLAGYDVSVLSDCLVKLSFKNISRFIICDSPLPKSSEPSELFF